jgi:hypothetical protein
MEGGGMFEAAKTSSKTELLREANDAIAPLLAKIRELNEEKRLIKQGKGERTIDIVDAEETACYDQMAPLHDKIKEITSKYLPQPS